LNDFYNLRRPGIRFRVDDVNPRRTQAWDNEVASFEVGMRSVRAERSTAGIPPEMVQFVARIGQIDMTYSCAVRRRAWIDVNHKERVTSRFVVRRERSDVSEALTRCFHRKASRRIKRWIGCPAEPRLVE